MQRRLLWLAGAAIVVAAAFVLRDIGRHEAGKVVDQDIQSAVAALPSGYTATHGAIEVNPITGTATLHDVSLFYTGQKLWQADTVTIAGANQVAMHTVFDPSAYPDGHPAGTARRTLVEDVTATGLHLSNPRDPDSVAYIRSVSLHHVGARQFFAPPTPDLVRTKAFAADAALAFSVQSLEVQGASMHSATTAKAFGFDHFTLRDDESGQVGRLALEGLSLDVTNLKPRPTHVQASLALVELKAFDLSQALLALRDNKPVPAGSSASSAKGSLNLAGFVLDVTPGPEITLASASASGTQADASGLRSGKAALNGLTLALKDTPLGASGEALVQAFGMNKITMDISATSATDIPASHTKIEEDIDLHDLGVLHLNVSAGLADPSLARTDPKAALMMATIDHGALSWVDKGLVNRVFAAAASQMHVSADMVRAQLAIPLVSLGFFLPDQPDAVDQVTRFLNHPGTIGVTLNPPAPFTLAAVGALPAEQRAHAMGVRIEAK